MIRTRELRRLLEKGVTEARQEGATGQAELRRGRVKFVEDVHLLLGIEEDAFGRKRIAEGAAKPEEFSLRELADTLLGHNWVDENWNPNNAGGLDRTTILEAGPGIDPTMFLNISTYSATVAGLIEAKVIENFNLPGYIGDQLVETVPTRLNGEKMIGVTNIASEAQTRKPGEPHPRAGFSENFVTTPETVEKSLAVEVTQEAAFFDLTSQVLQVAGGVGEVLGYGREKTIADLVLGVTNPYVRKGTGYITYQSTTPWINTHTNVMQDYSDIDAALKLFEQMTDPDTGKEILVMPDTILHMPQRRSKFYTVLNATEVRETTNTNTVSIAPNPIKGRYALLESPIWYNRVKDVTGLNAGTTHGPEYWYFGKFKKAFKWMENWPLRVRQANAAEYAMVDRGLIAAYFANYRGIGAVVEPRYVVRNISA